jgi:methylase of polypeptide subunit release factors
MGQIREVLDRAGYADSTIQSLLGTGTWPAHRQRQRELPLYLWRTRGGSPLETLVRLFVLRQPVPLDAARRAVEPMRIEDWAEAGLIRLSGPIAVPTVELCPYQNLIAAADWPDAADIEGEPVMGIAASSRTLADMALRRPVSRTLDLGTGCGILALLAARHSEGVVAVDCNPRALCLARRNAELNGANNIDFHPGDWLEPVRELTFDLIICNPPFVIGPGGAPVHTQSGLPADQLCRTLVQAAPAHLREGGFCQLLCNWACIAGEEWRARLAGWFQGTGCDAWVLHSHTEDAADYAMRRALEATNDAETAARLFDDWQAYFKREGIEAVGFGLVTQRRVTSRPNWFRCDRLPAVHGPCGADIERGFRLRDFLEAHRDDRSLLHARLRHAPSISVDAGYKVSGTAWVATRSQISLPEGLAYSGLADEGVLEFLRRCTGERPLGEVLAGQARTPVSPQMLAAVRGLVEQGFLLPVDN